MDNLWPSGQSCNKLKCFKPFQGLYIIGKKLKDSVSELVMSCKIIPWHLPTFVCQSTSLCWSADLFVGHSTRTFVRPPVNAIIRVDGVVPMSLNYKLNRRRRRRRRNIPARMPQELCWRWIGMDFTGNPWLLPAVTYLNMDSSQAVFQTKRALGSRTKRATEWCGGLWTSLIGKIEIGDRSFN